MRKKCTFFFAFAMLLFSLALQAQNKIFVKADAAGNNNGTNWTDAYTNLQNAINHAAAGDSIFAAAGTYTPTGNSFNLKDGVKIYGGFSGTENSLKQRNIAAALAAGDTTILTNNANGYSIISNYPVLAITIATVLDGFTFSNGNRTLGDYGSGGGAIDNYDASPTIVNCIFENNKSNYGAWVNEQNSNPVIKHCTFINNSALYGGAMCNFTSSPVIDSCTFEENTAEFSGGAMHNTSNSSPVVTHCTFANNTSTTYTATTETGPVVFPGSGGAVANIECTPLFAHCIFTGNKVTNMGDGGAMVNSSTAIAVIDSCTFTGNTTDLGNGAAILNVNDHAGETTTVVVSNCTFSGNTANGEFSGGYFNGGFGAAICNKSTTDTIRNCKFLSNTATFGGAGVSDYYGDENSTITGSLFYGNTAYDPIDSYGAGTAYQHTDGDASIINCVFANNNAAGSNDDGGAILAYGGTLNIINSTFSNNTSASYNTGSGALSGIGYYSDVNFNIINSIVYGDDAQQVYTGVSAYAATANYDHSLVKGVSVISPNLNTDPLFVNAANPSGADGAWGTADDGLMLQRGSPAINAGTPDTTGLYTGNTDFAGNSRITGTIDMGAYEYQNAGLPVTLLSFTASLQNRVAQLQWHTGVESNFNHFEIEKSTGGSAFRPLQESAANGSNSYYTYSTQQPEATAYYRLKMFDNDGNASYSNIVELSQNSSGSIILYPNPAKDYINIKAGNVGNVRIYNASGVLVKTIPLQKGINKIDIRNLAAGICFIVSGNQEIKFIKQ